MADHTPSFPAPAVTGTARRKVLIFHIGDHKTGSTSIQLAFAQRQVALANGSIFYPARISNNFLAKHCKAYANPDRPKAKAEAEEVFRRKAKQVQESDAPFALISAESLEGVPPPVLREILERFFADAANEIRVVAYVRPHAGRLLSSFSERTKTGAPRVIEGDLYSFYERSRDAKEFFYLPRFTAWREAFGDRFLLRPMIRSELYQGSVVDDFVRHTFGTEDFTIATGEQANESLELVDLMRLKVLQARILDIPNRDLRRTMGWEFARIVGTIPRPEEKTKLRLHRKLAQDIHDTYLKDARAMDRTFFEGRPLLETELKSAVETAIPEPQSTDPAAYLSASELRSLGIFSDLVSEMLRNDAVDWPAFLHSKRLNDVKKSQAAE